MTEEQAQVVKPQEVGAPEAKTAETSSLPQTSQTNDPGTKEYNWRQMERRQKELEQQNRELIDALKGKLQPQVPVQTEDDSLPNLSPDDIPEWKHVKKSLDSFERKAERIAEEKVKRILAEQEKAKLPATVRGKFSDFDQVVTQERIEKLEKENPELAEAFTKAADPYTATYSYLKALYLPKSQDPVAMEEAQKILENAKKPKSSNAAGAQGALKNASAFAKKSKEQLYKEMMAFSARAS
jgi:hypothetical protein